MYYGILFFNLACFCSQQILNLTLHQTLYFEDLSFQSQQLQKNRADFDIIVELEITNNSYFKNIPVLLYCPQGFPDQVMNLSVIMGMAQNTNSPKCFMDSDGVLRNTGHQSITLSNSSFPSHFSQLYSKTNLKITGGTILLGVFLITVDGSLLSTNYKATIRQQYRSNTNDDCQRSCTGQGVCSGDYLVCQCPQNYLDKDCSFQASVQSYPSTSSINLYKQKSMRLLIPLNNVDTNLGSNFQFRLNWQRNYVGLLHFSYQCVGSRPYLPFFNDQFIDNYSILDSNQEDEIIDILDFTTADISSCLATANSLNQSLGIQFIPQLLLEFYNPQDQNNKFQLLINYQQVSSQQQSTGLEPIYIVIIVLSSTFICIIGTFWFRNKNFMNQPQQNIRTVQQITQADRVKRIKEQNLIAINRYMPAKQYSKVIEELPDMKEIVECLVCLTPWEESDQVRVTTCFHLFHQHCLDEWLSRHQTCPFCRVLLDRKALKEASDFYTQQDATDRKNQKLNSSKKDQSLANSSSNNLSIILKIRSETSIQQSQSSIQQSQSQSNLDNEYIRRMRHKSLSKNVQGSNHQKQSLKRKDNRQRSSTSSSAHQYSSQNQHQQEQTSINFSIGDDNSFAEQISIRKNPVEFVEHGIGLAESNVSLSSQESQNINQFFSLQQSHDGSRVQANHQLGQNFQHLGTIDEVISRDDLGQSRMGGSPFAFNLEGISASRRHVDRSPAITPNIDRSDLRRQVISSDSPSQLQIKKSQSDNQTGQFKRNLTRGKNSMNILEQQPEQIPFVKIQPNIAEEHNKNSPEEIQIQSHHLGE